MSHSHSIIAKTPDRRRLSASACAAAILAASALFAPGYALAQSLSPGLEGKYTPSPMPTQPADGEQSGSGSMQSHLPWRDMYPWTWGRLYRQSEGEMSRIDPKLEGESPEDILSEIGSDKQRDTLGETSDENNPFTAQNKLRRAWERQAEWGAKHDPDGSIRRAQQEAFDRLSSRNATSLDMPNPPMPQPPVGPYAESEMPRSSSLGQQYENNLRAQLATGEGEGQ